MIYLFISERTSSNGDGTEDSRNDLNQRRIDYQEQLFQPCKNGKFHLISHRRTS